MNDFSSRLKALRSGRNLTQSELAQDLGLSKSTVNMYEHGEREPGLATLRQLADYFYVDADYLLGRTESAAGRATPLHSAARDCRATLDDLKSTQQLLQLSLLGIFSVTGCGTDAAGQPQPRGTEAFCAYFRALLDAMPEAERHNFRHLVLSAMDAARAELSAAESVR